MVKEFYDYQERDIATIFDTLKSNSATKILYQLPTGAEKIVIFSEIARRFLEQSDKTVLILTHRKELCKQTSNTLRNLGVENTVIRSSTVEFDPNANCYVAMVETLKNRIKKKKIKVQKVGLVIIDEAQRLNPHNETREP